MESQAEELVGNLSGGQYQRMLIARALMGNPDLLILDEPSTGVDVSSQKEIYTVLHRLNTEQKLTILAVEHNLYAAARYSSMLYHIANGHGHLCTPQHYLDAVSYTHLDVYKRQQKPLSFYLCGFRTIHIGERTIGGSFRCKVIRPFYICLF